MKHEIESKFLVINPTLKNDAITHNHIKQGYLYKNHDRTERVQIKDGDGWLTIKCKSNSLGTSRLEWETEIPFEEAKALLKLPVGQPIENIRHIILS